MFSKRTILGILMLAMGITGYTLSKTTHSTAPSANHVAHQNQDPAVPVAETGKTPHVEIVNAEGQSVGTTVLKQESNGVSLRVSVSHLAPGKHGIHIHEAAFKDADFESAGSHFNPYRKHHGLKNPKGPHLGDMPNLEVKADGTAEQTLFIAGATLEKGKENSIAGRSIIIHEKEDDQVSDPAGNSGGRIAGGVIPQ